MTDDEKVAWNEFWQWLDQRCRQTDPYIHIGAPVAWLIKEAMDAGWMLAGLQRHRVDLVRAIAWGDRRRITIRIGTDGRFVGAELWVEKADAQTRRKADVTAWLERAE